MKAILFPFAIAFGVTLGNLATLAVLFMARKQIIELVAELVDKGY